MSKGKVLKIEEHASKQGGNFFYVFVKLEDGRSARTCLYPFYRNWKQWEYILQPSFDKDTLLEGFEFSKRDTNLLDADFGPRPVKIAETPLAPTIAPQPTPAPQVALFGDQWTRGSAALKKARQEAGVR